MTAPADPTLVRLLDIEPELASRLREDDRAEARQRLVARTLTLPQGADAAGFRDARDHPFGLVVVDGILLQDVHVAGRSSVQLLGRGDVLVPRAPTSEVDVALRWTAATATTVALLDDHLQPPLTLWPGLALGLVERVAQQLTRAAVHAATLQLPRVEDRLEATFWDLADRWGRVTPSGIHLPLKLTHDVLARLVGGARPTISLALTALGERDIVARRHDGTWLLVADRPSAALREAGAAPTPALIAMTPEDPRPTEPDAWLPGARAELLATAQRVVDEFTHTTERADTDHGRFAATRARSRSLREQTAADRASRRTTRAANGPPLRLPRPAAPSAG
ncbi:MAG TPA: Crp/Fnr family transcriptional regulator [Baekduia sp.]|nr:Crp/Fnr family transcriptional regulator [Baekduia sp.]